LALMIVSDADVSEVRVPGVSIKQRAQDKSLQVEFLGVSQYGRASQLCLSLFAPNNTAVNPAPSVHQTATLIPSLYLFKQCAEKFSVNDSQASQKLYRQQCRIAFTCLFKSSQEPTDPRIANCDRVSFLLERMLQLCDQGLNDDESLREMQIILCDFYNTFSVTREMKRDLDESMKAFLAFNNVSIVSVKSQIINHFNLLEIYFYRQEEFGETWTRKESLGFEDQNMVAKMLVTLCESHRTKSIDSHKSKWECMPNFVGYAIAYNKKLQLIFDKINTYFEEYIITEHAKYFRQVVPCNHRQEYLDKYFRELPERAKHFADCESMTPFELECIVFCFTQDAFETKQDRRISWSF